MCGSRVLNADWSTQDHDRGTCASLVDVDLYERYSANILTESVRPLPVQVSTE